MTGVEGFSEYEGGGVMPNTVFPKSAEALTASDKLRLMSTTGQMEDSQAPVDPYFWYGNSYPDANEETRLAQEAIAKRRARDKAVRDRYRESRR